MGAGLPLVALEHFAAKGARQKRHGGSIRGPGVGAT